MVGAEKGSGIQMKKVMAFAKSEIVLTVAVLLALVSMFVIPPDTAYAGYIDFRTLAVLFCLMAVMAGFQEAGVFQWIAEKMLKKVSNVFGVVYILVLLCFFFSMLITNDVALITFVPFTFIVLKLLGDQLERKLIVPVVVMQTIAANLGSMLTPIGNPQNLYLYGKSGLSFGAFMLLMLPYAAVSFVLLTGYCIFLGRQKQEVQVDFAASTGLKGKEKAIFRYLALFLVSLLVVVHVIPYPVALAIVIVVMGLFDRKLFTRIDYALLLTFVGFFVFIGNMGRVPVFYEFLARIIEGNEVMTAVVSSQVISNVPAALLLSGFTENVGGLIVGTNLGGLGTLIASMASLISYKLIAKSDKCSKGTYFKSFTLWNVAFLAVLLAVHACLS